MRKRYPLNQSPFYRLQRRKALGELLGMTSRALETLANSALADYRCFERVTPRIGKQPKRRWIEWPQGGLRQVQRSVAKLLDRIEPPLYIHSGFRGRSYVTNANQHRHDVRVAKIDIRAFFPNASWRYVHRCFQDLFLCSPDVAAILTKLTTISGHLPTGGNTSTIISFYTYKPMFDEIYELAVARGLVMSCCVDDMTFSGDGATSGFLNEVRIIVGRYGLKTHKRHCFEPGQTKVVTGLALTPQGVRLPNARRKKLHETLDAFDREPDWKKRVKLGEQLLGRITEAAQIEQQFRPLMRIAAIRVKEAKQEQHDASRTGRRRRLVPAKLGILA